MTNNKDVNNQEVQQLKLKLMKNYYSLKALSFTIILNLIIVTLLHAEGNTNHFNGKNDTVKYTISLLDDYGDGWDGHITVKVNGNSVISNFSLPGGFGPLDSTFKVSDKDEISTVYNSNNSMYANEEYYHIKNERGVVVVSDGENGVTPTGISNYKVHFPDSNDVAPLSINLDERNIGLSSSTTLMTEIKNQGINTQTDIPLKISVDSGLTFVDDTIFGSLDSFQQVNHSFDSLYDLSKQGQYHIWVVSDLDGDDNKNNDTIKSTVQNDTIPYEQTFDSLSTITGYLSVNNNTQSGGVSLEQSQCKSSPNSLCLNNGSNDNGSTLMATLPPIYSNMTNKWVSFDYYFGQTSDSLIVGVMKELPDTSLFIPLDTVVPESYESWVAQKALLPDTIKKPFFVTFKHTSNDAFSEIFIDNINISQGPSGPIFAAEPDTLDAGEIILNFPDSTFEEVKIYNKGTDFINISSVDISGGNSSNFEVVDTNSYPQNLGVYDYISLTVKFTGNTNGLKTSDLTVTTDSAIHQIPLYGTVLDATIDSFNWVESFDDNKELNYGWQNNDNQYSWRTHSGNTVSSNTGPVSDAKSNDGIYVYTDANSGSQGEEAHLITPPLDLSGLSNPKLKFWYHMYGVDINALYIDAAINNDWVVIDSLKGSKQKAEDAPWILHETSLSNYSEADSVRFRAVRGGGCYGDIAIDNVAFGEDLNVSLGPDTAVCQGESLTLDPGSYSSYQWFSGSLNNLVDTSSQLTIDTTSQYIIKVSDEGDFLGYDSINFSVNPVPNDVIISGPVTMDYNGTASFTAEAGLGTLSYDWYNGDTTQTVTLDHNDVNPGDDTISVVVTNNFGCAKSQWKHIYVINPSGIKPMDELQNIEVFPNPTSEYLNIEFNTTRENLNITIIDQHGKIVQNNAYKGGVKTKTINVSHLSSGVYYLSVSSGKEQVVRKLIVE